MGLRSRVVKAARAAARELLKTRTIVKSVGVGYGLRDTRVTPTLRELVTSLCEVAWHPANLNAGAVGAAGMRLYVKRGKGTPNYPVKGLTRSERDGLRARTKGIANRIIQGGDVVEVTSHPALDLLENVSSMFDGFNLMHLTQMSLDIIGRMVWIVEINDTGDNGESYIFPITGHKVIPYYTTDGDIQYKLPDGTTLDQSKAIIFRQPDLDDPYLSVWSPMRSIFRSCGLIDLDIDLAWSMMASRARPDVLLFPKGEESVVGDDERERLELQLNNMYATGVGGALVGQVPLDAVNIGYTAREMDAVKRIENLTERIYNAFDVPIAFSTKSTNMANLQAAMIQHGRFGLVPRLTRIAQVLNQQYCKRWDDSLFFWFDDPVPDDQLNRVKVQQIEYMIGKKNPNELRAEDGLPPRDGGDEYTKQQTPMMAGGDGSQVDPKKSGKNKDTQAA